MTAARTRLRGLANAAGYGPEALALIADAALPGRLGGERLADRDIVHIATAVEVLAQAATPAAYSPT